MDQLKQHLVDKVAAPQRVEAVAAFLDEECYDTDLMKQDMKTLDEEKQSHFSRTFEAEKDIINETRRFMRHHRVTSGTFSTGFVFWYWPFYNDRRAENYVKNGSQYQ